MRHRLLLAGALALAAISLSAGTASATPSFSLRVEAPGQTLDPGTLFASRSPIGALRGESLPNGDCVRGAGNLPLAGQTALGLVASAANATKPLQPLFVAEDSFGKRVCRVASFNETDTPFSGWLYRVNHVAPPFAADLAELKKGDEVLWVFANFGSGVNTGDELVLTAPVRATPGPVEVTVNAVTFDGNVNPAPDGTVVSGGTTPAVTAGGKALVTLGQGTSALRAVGPGAAPLEIPSNQAEVCVAAQLAACPAQRGLRLVGTNLRDKFKGGAGPDVIRTRGGRDRIRVRGGASDVVNCGNGRDLVVADASDELRRCEKVKGV
jgi:hypothetical protein